ncbi:MAG TPA: hypothetical protein VNA20_15835 [Frankiaceae bacterium]|nr:hypothetical protein [Frankiaceae bacterium]
MRETEQRKRVERAFREVHAAVLKPRGYALKKMTSARPGPVLTSVRVEPTPGGHEANYPVEVVYLAGVPVGNEPTGLVWGVAGALADASGNPRFLVPQFGDDELVAELASRIERDVVPFLDQLATPDDLLAFFGGPWAEAEARYLQPQSPVKREMYRIFLAEAAGKAAVAEAARAALVDAAEATGMADEAAYYLRQAEERVARWRETAR